MEAHLILVLFFQQIYFFVVFLLCNYLYLCDVIIRKRYEKTR